MYYFSRANKHKHNTMEALKTQIENLKKGRTLAQLKSTDQNTYYRVQGLSETLSQLKAASKGQFITKENLTEFKGLIIWNLKRCDYRGHLNLKAAMTLLLNRVESEKIIFKTQAGIKGIVSKLAVSAGLEDVEANLRAENGLSITDNSYGNSVLESFTQHRINILMG